jgi:hypothetical protein
MIYLTITIDVEPDCTPTWHYSKPLTFDGVKIGIKEILQPLFNKYHVKPTYLINNVVLEDEESVEVFKNLDGEYELGTHLHAEFIEPNKIFYDYAGKKGEMNQCFLEPEIEYEKIKNITKLFIKNFRYQPLSFRAGRFSAGSNTINCLEELGYKIDTSVTPHINWNDKTREKPVDFSNIYEQPFFIKKNSFFEKDINGKILEVPVSIINKKNFLPIELLKSGMGIRRKPHLYKIQWLRPVFSNYKQLCEIYYYIVKLEKCMENVVLNMMFHNVDILPGKSPYIKFSEESKEHLFILESFFSFLRLNKIIPVTLQELYTQFNGR